MKVELINNTLYVLKGFYSSYDIILVDNLSGGSIERRGIYNTTEILKTLILYRKISKSS